MCTVVVVQDMVFGDDTRPNGSLVAVRVCRPFLENEMFTTDAIATRSTGPIAVDIATASLSERFQLLCLRLACPRRVGGGM